MDILARMLEFNHDYASLYDHVGGWLSIKCFHSIWDKVSAASKISRDYMDILRFLHHLPAVNIADIVKNICTPLESD